MQVASKKVIEKLKEIIDHNGPKYLMLEPYMVYREILKSKAADRRTAGAILCVLVSNALKNIQSEDNRVLLSKMIREECGFSREMSDKLATIFLGVYSTENKKEWRNKGLKGCHNSSRKIRFIAGKDSRFGTMATVRWIVTTKRE